MARRSEPTPAMLGYAQRCVLCSLAGDECDVRTLSYNWPGLSESSARSAVMSLSKWGLVDAARFENRSRLFKLTERGHEYAARLFGDDLDEASEALENDGEWREIK